MPNSASELFFTAGLASGDRSGAPTGEAFMHSTDGGATWADVAGVTEVITFGYGAPRADGGPATIDIVGWVDGQYGIWQSADDAHSWVQIGQLPLESLDSIKTISGDMDISGRVYVGFAGSGYAYLDIPTQSSSGTESPIAVSDGPTAPTPVSVAPAEDTAVGAIPSVDDVAPAWTGLPIYWQMPFLDGSVL
jgi:hypothetical protein